MNNTVTTQQENNSKKIFVLRIAIYTIIGIAIGLLIPTVMKAHENSSSSLFASLSEYITLARLFVLPALMMIAFVLYVFISSFKIAKCQTALEAWDGEDEDSINDIDAKLNIQLIVSNTFYVINQIYFGLFTYDLINTVRNRSAGLFFAGIAVYFFFLFACFNRQSKIINLVKQYAPEKRGSLYDKNFAKVWMESCDEAEQKMIGQAAFKAFQTTNKLLAILIIVFIIIGLFLPIGFLISLVIGIIWLVSTLSYSIEAHRIEHKH